jgi:sulfatase maturation enzyme AslB (radical SAM superfamily)
LAQSDTKIDAKNIPPPSGIRGFHLMANPSGSAAISLTYCFYQEKEVFFSDQERFYADDVLEAYVGSTSPPAGNLVVFDWQGGNRFCRHEFHPGALNSKKIRRRKTHHNSVRPTHASG